MQFLKYRWQLPLGITFSPFLYICILGIILSWSNANVKTSPCTKLSNSLNVLPATFITYKPPDFLPSLFQTPRSCFWILLGDNLGVQRAPKSVKYRSRSCPKCILVHVPLFLQICASNSIRFSKIFDAPTRQKAMQEPAWKQPRNIPANEHKHSFVV